MKRRQLLALLVLVSLIALWILIEIAT